MISACLLGPGTRAQRTGSGGGGVVLGLGGTPRAGRTSGTLPAGLTGLTPGGVGGVNGNGVGGPLPPILDEDDLHDVLDVEALLEAYATMADATKATLMGLGAWQLRAGLGWERWVKPSCMSSAQ